MAYRVKRLGMPIFFTYILLPVCFYNVKVPGEVYNRRSNPRVRRMYMSVREFLFNQYIAIQAKMIDKQLEEIDWESDYGLTSEIMEEVKQRIYERIMEQIRIYEASK